MYDLLYKYWFCCLRPSAIEKMMLLYSLDVYQNTTLLLHLVSMAWLFESPTRAWHNMTWQHSFRSDPSYVQSCIANHVSNVLFMLRNIEGGTAGAIIATKHVWNH